MTDEQKKAMRAALDADLNPAIATALANVTTLFGARKEAQNVVDHMVDDIFRDDLVEKMAAAADAAAR
jgi:hypothetical protein